MKIRLGYACISNIINTTSSKSITLTHYNNINDKERNQILDNIINMNLNNLEILIKYNSINNIHFFRMTSNLIPLIDIANIDLAKYKSKFIKIGNTINKYKMRVDCHIDQYCVLNSINKETVLNSINMLNDLKKVMDLFNIKYNIIMHIGSTNGGKIASIKRFINNFNLLDENLKNKIIIENDDKSYNAYNTLKLAEKLNIPMCLDIHHHNCNKCSKNIEYYLNRIINTFKEKNPKMHFSSPKTKKEYRTHNDFINKEEFIDFINIIKKCKQNVDVMLEAKQKDLALIKLVYELKYEEIYDFIDESSFNI